MLQHQYLIVTGNPVEGFKFLGPFSNRFSAELYMRGALGHWWTARLETPNDHLFNHRS